MSAERSKIKAARIAVVNQSITTTYSCGSSPRYERLTGAAKLEGPIVASGSRIIDTKSTNRNVAAPVCTEVSTTEKVAQPPPLRLKLELVNMTVIFGRCPHRDRRLAEELRKMKVPLDPRALSRFGYQP